MKIINQFTRRLLIGLVAVTFNSICSAQVSYQLQQPLPFDKSVHTGRLANGFTYYIRYNAEPKNRVVMYLVNKVGSILETQEQRGLAHFMEHMNFNGTTHFPKNQLVDYLEKAGVRFGADINAYTSFDETVYQLPMPSDNAEILRNGLQIMRDWAHGALLETAEIDKERGVILEEKRLGKGAGERMQRQYYPFLLNGSKYAERSPIGTDEVLTGFKPETLRAFYKDWYRPDLQALIVVGDVDVKEMERAIRDKFADLKNPAPEKARANYAVELTGKNRYMAVTDKEMTSTVAEIIIKSKGKEIRTGADYRNSMIEALFNQMLDQRLNEIRQKPDVPFLQGSAGIGGFIGGLKSFTAQAVTKPEKGGLEKAFKAIWREAFRLREQGFTEVELTRAKTNYMNSIENIFKEADKVKSGSYVNEYVQHFLKGESAPGLPFEYQFVKAKLPGIKLAELNYAARSLIKDTDRDVLVLAPEKDKANLPDESTINSWLKEVAAEPMQAYQEASSLQPFLTKTPVPGRIVKEATDPEFNITTLTLSNDVKVVLKPTTYKNNQVLMSAFAPGGTNLYSDQDYQSAANAAGLINFFGAGNYSPVALSKYFTGKQIAISTGIGETSQQISGGSTTKDLPAMLELMYAYLTEPRKDSAKFASIISNAKAGLINRKNDPSSVFQDTSAAILSNYNVRKTGPSVEKLSQISLDRAYEIYQERFGDVSGFTFIFTGSFKPDSIKGFIEKYIGGLPAKHTPAKINDLGIHIPPGIVSKTVYKGTEPKATVQLYFSGPFQYTLRDRIELDALREALSLRLIARLREDEGGVYSPSVTAHSVKIPSGRYVFTVSFGCSPANVEKLITSTLDEIEQLKTLGPPQVNVDKLITETLRQRETYVLTNEWWHSSIYESLQNGESLQDLDDYVPVLKSIDPSAIKVAAQKYLSGKNYIKLVLMPENMK
ncbi:M16 family metallopeptidase [Mucilaginibacter ximonensis]|uniref:M16 family metallopeptidase n=1 Tax=Mucilaginibacter ximonensis TaxID=538021 RepID=A0ABW5Y949_9SPHI